MGNMYSVEGDRYIANVAVSLIGKLHITWRDGQSLGAALREYSHGIFGQTLYERREIDVRKEVSKMRPETLGRIAVQGLSKNDPRTERQPQRSGVTKEGKTSLYSVHCGTYLPKYDSGRALLIELVVTALIAEMTDQLVEKMHREAEREPLTTEGM